MGCFVIGSCSFDSRQYFGSVLRDLETTSRFITAGPRVMSGLLVGKLLFFFKKLHYVYFPNRNNAVVNGGKLSLHPKI